VELVECLAVVVDGRGLVPVVQSFDLRGPELDNVFVQQEPRFVQRVSAVEVVGVLVDVVAVATLDDAHRAAYAVTLSATVNAVRQPRRCNSSPTSVSEPRA